MKKIIIYTLLLMGTVSHAFAQKDAQARAILNAVSKKYRSYNVVKSDFIFTLNAPQAADNQTRTGTLTVQAKTNKYKLLLYGNDGKTVDQEITSDGKSQWTYIKKDKEVQLNNADHSDEGFNPAQMFTLYEKGFKYIYTGDTKVDGKLCQMIDLSPEDIDKSYFKIRLAIDKAKKQLISALIFDKNGSKYTYFIRTFTPNVSVSDSFFTYDKKSNPGIEVVDLR